MEVLDNSKVVTIGVRKKDEIRPCIYCGKDCKKTYWFDYIDNKEVWICKECHKKLFEIPNKKGEKDD